MNGFPFVSKWVNLGELRVFAQESGACVRKEIENNQICLEDELRIIHVAAPTPRISASEVL